MAPSTSPRLAAPDAPAATRTGSTRDRLIDATVALLREKGPSASGTTEILTVAGAPRGSFYHHFPEGKDQLVVAAVERAGAATYASIEAALRDDGVPLPVRIEALLLAVSADQVADDFRLGCAVGATTLEAACEPGPLRTVTREVFATWTTLLTDVLRTSGVGAADAEALADTIVSTMEGATMLARARQDTAPLDHAAGMARRLVAAVLDGPR